MKRIPLTRNRFALVSDEDYERVNVHRWHAKSDGHRWYAARATGPRGHRKTVYLHRFIIDAPGNKQVDHIDGNGLNCQRENLRLATKSQNMMNRSELKNNTSGYKGVAWHNRSKKWVAIIKFDGNQKLIGYFGDKKKAARAYDEAAREYHGEFARLNFPD